MNTHVIGTGLDYWIIIIYFVAIFLFGSFFAKFTRNTKDFFLGGQRFAWWLIAFSYIASIVGSYSFVKYSEIAFKFGLSSTMSYLNDWIVMGFLLFGWVPILYFTRSTSVPEYFSKRFDQKTRAMATIFVMIYMVGYIGINLFTMGVAMNAMLGIDIFWASVIVAIICAIYVTAGGQTAVIMTDLVQGVLLLFAGLLLLILGIRVIGGFDTFWNSLPVWFKLPFAEFSKPKEFHFAGVFWQDGVANNVALYMMNQGFILRFLALKSVKDAKKTFLSLILILMPLAALAVANAGWLGKSMVTLGMLPANIDPKHIFVAVTNKVCSPGMFGFIMAALVAALMSTVDTLINAVSVVSVNDIYKPYIKKQATDKHYLKVARIISLLAAVVGIALVPLFASFKSIYSAHGAFIAFVTPPMVVVIIIGAMWKKFTPAGAFSALVGGALMMFASTIWPVLVTPFSHGADIMGGDNYMRALYGLVVSGIIGIGVSLFTKPKKIEEIEGYVLGTLKKAKEIYKGSPNINEEDGEIVEGTLNLSNDLSTVFEISEKFAKRLKANIGDMVYLSDARGWLGGLRSIHTRITKIHENDESIINISKDLMDEGELVLNRPHKIEKII